MFLKRPWRKPGPLCVGCRPQLSGGIYLWHTTVIANPVTGLELVPPAAWLAIPVTLASAVTVALASYVGVERTGIAVGRWLSSGRTGRIAKVDGGQGRP